MTLQNVEVRPKIKRQHENQEVFEKSSDITVYNVYEQDYQTLVEEGLAHWFADKADFEQQKGER
ncbi:hypothetical protein ACKXGF_09935 [Alkalibacillus sp. S2W]|uniref:hypothetical protein n=1 Tax=Alkalibacillus sp. S2W TaxID=3386553 RepID=UPI00398D1585